MLTPDHLTHAVEKGLISEEQRGGLLELSRLPLPLRNDDGEPATAGDESFRLVGGGNDVFIAIGILLLMVGAWFTLSTVSGSHWSMICAYMTVFVWAVAEFITRQKRMKFSSLLLSATCLGMVMTWLGWWINSNFQVQAPDNPLQIIGMRDEVLQAGLIACAVLAVSAIIYFLRFRVPFMVAAITVSVIGLVTLFVGNFVFDRVLDYSIQIADENAVRIALQKLLYVPLVCGLLVFIVGVIFDIKDSKRETLWSDCAFWLHVISAPLIVHPLFTLASGQNQIISNNIPSPTASLLLVGLVFVFFYVALAIDRRSLLVPSLGYFGTVGIYYIVNVTANSTGIPSFAIILVVIGLMIIMFGAGWQRIRSLVIGSTLPSSLIQKLPPVKI